MGKKDCLMKKLDWAAIFIPMILVNMISYVGNEKINWNLLFLSTGILVFVFILCMKYLTEKEDLEFWNDVELKKSNEENKVRHVLHFKNNTKTKISVDGYRFEVMLGDKLLRSTGDMHISGFVIDESVKDQRK